VDGTPTPEPTRTPAPPWQPGDTASDAFATLKIVVRGLATLAIWTLIVVLPILVPIAAGVWLVNRWRVSRRNRPGA
jgi:hypothetical protein